MEDQEAYVSSEQERQPDYELDKQTYKLCMQNMKCSSTNEPKKQLGNRT
jgi:hypothetical protein